MSESGVEAELAGAEAVKQWFGNWPSFHDAEVISLSLARKGQSVLRVYPCYPHKPATVDFIFEDVTDIELQDFSGQNVIMSLGIETATDQNGGKVYRLVSARVTDWPGESTQSRFVSSCRLARVRMASASGETLPRRWVFAAVCWPCATIRLT